MSWQHRGRHKLAEVARRSRQLGCGMKEGPMQILYTASATATGGRAGHVRSSEGPLDFDLTWPKELGGAGGTGTKPEDASAAGYAACFAQALVRGARDRNVPLNAPPAVTADVGIGRL